MENYFPSEFKDVVPFFLSIITGNSDAILNLDLLYVIHFIFMEVFESISLSSLL